ncbi:cation diffusion facilitator family transporter [Acidocella sp.]|uniref:cation diffusion facilitator family transporter n=1 Tax=Acidocella sp. TaxID=50710 RepID=UPI002631DD6E|nr:cation diffusion facilitator family transporter [Acidocella sp.]
MPHDHGHDHAGAHGHGGHSHAPADFGRAFAIGLALNLAYVFGEAGFGLAGHSLALLADAGHNLSDVLGLAGAWGATALGRRLPSARYTYGLRRSSILTALGNAVLLLVVTGGIAWEAIQRLFHPGHPAGLTIVVVALIGIAVNGVTALLFLSGRKNDLNIRGVFLHMAADALVSAGTAAAGLVILLTGYSLVDPLVSLAISVVIVAGTWSLLRDSLNLSLDAVPEGIDLAAVEAYLRGLPGVVAIHDLHIWGYSTSDTALTAHLVSDEVESSALLPRIAEDMRHRFGIGHATIQLESTEVAAACHLRPAEVI